MRLDTLVGTGITVRAVVRQPDGYPELLQLLGGSLHQDFDLEYPSADAALEDAIRSAPDELLRLAEQQLNEALARLDDEAEAEVLVRQMCDYYPPGDGRTFIGWLRLVQEQVAEGRS